MFKLGVSVIITCYNLDKYLKECIESVRAQTMSPSEVIIVHDGCTHVPLNYQGATNVYRGLHKGVARTRHEGALLATSETLLFLDADDCLEEYFIESMVKTKAKSKADIIYPNVLLWSSWHPEVKLKNAWYESANKITWKNMMDYNQVVVTSLIPTKMYFELGGFGNFPILEDYDFWLKALKAGFTFAKSPSAVLKYRQREEGRNRKNHELKNQFMFEIKEKYASTKPQFPTDHS